MFYNKKTYCLLPHIVFIKRLGALESQLTTQEFNLYKWPIKHKSNSRVFVKTRTQPLE